MERSRMTTAGEPGSVAERAHNLTEPVEVRDLVDELGPIPSFPPLALDPKTGRVLPISEEERAARREAALRMLKVLHQITDENDTDERWREVFRSIDAGRPHRPLFEGLY